MRLGKGRCGMKRRTRRTTIKQTSVYMGNGVCWLSTGSLCASWEKMMVRAEHDVARTLLAPKSLVHVASSSACPSVSHRLGARPRLPISRHLLVVVIILRNIPAHLGRRELWQLRPKISTILHDRSHILDESSCVHLTTPRPRWRTRRGGGRAWILVAWRFR